MTRQEILDALRRCASLEINENGDADHIGSIARSWTFYLNHIKSENKSCDYYSSYQAYYDRCKAELESLPWNVVDNPRNPKDGEYPSEDGTYITMLDCNEHEVLTNDFREGFWTLYNRTHIKWWMKLPETDPCECQSDFDKDLGCAADSIMKWLNDKYCKSHVLKKIGETVYNFVNKNLCLVIVMEIVGIVMAIVGHYGTMGFDWRWFLFFELPVYVFICWAAWKTIGIYKKSKELECKNNHEKA